MSQKKQKRSEGSLAKIIAGCHLISTAPFTKNDLNLLMESADRMRDLVKKQGGDERLKRKVLALVFYEPSTRTSCSFQTAMQRLGGTVISVNPQSSSIQKGETIEDTVQTLCCYCDGIVMRHPTKGSLAAASKVCNKALISAGDGVGEHPTQGLLDLYTICAEMGSLGSKDSTNPMTIAVVGDLKHGRTTHSLVRLLKLYTNVRLLYVSPESLSMPDEIIEELRRDTQIEQVVMRSLDEAIAQADVLYMTRIQKERFATQEEYDQVSGVYRLDTTLMAKAKTRMIVMHPLPRVDEIAIEVDADPRAAYIRQMENGMYMRMAILDDMLVDK